MTEPKTVDYFAVPDPDDPGRMTYWRQGPRGLVPWPPRARYGPVLLKRDVPKGMAPQARREWVHTWFVEHKNRWTAAVVDSIRADERAAAARFATFRTRCCCCGRALTDPASKTYATGPECRTGLPADVLAGLSEAVGRVHAEAVITQPTEMEIH